MLIRCYPSYYSKLYSHLQDSPSLFLRLKSQAIQQGAAELCGNTAVSSGQRRTRPSSPIQDSLGNNIFYTAITCSDVDGAWAEKTEGSTTVGLYRFDHDGVCKTDFVRSSNPSKCFLKVDFRDFWTRKGMSDWTIELKEADCTAKYSHLFRMTTFLKSMTTAWLNFLTPFFFKSQYIYLFTL